MELKVHMWDLKGKYREGNYDTFKLLENENYTLLAEDFWSDNHTFTLDAFGSLSSGQKFSTFDNDLDDELILTCAKEFQAPGW